MAEIAIAVVGSVCKEPEKKSDGSVDLYFENSEYKSTFCLAHISREDWNNQADKYTQNAIFSVYGSCRAAITESNKSCIEIFATNVEIMSS